MEQQGKTKSVMVKVTDEEKASLEFIAHQMDERHRRGKLEVGEQLSLQYLHALLWRIREALGE